jgi:two-component system phosphate regulon response regulator PhoB
MSDQRVLIVEDDENIRELVGRILTKEGFETRLVDSGEGALRAVAEENFHLIILDLMLPGLDGLEIARRLKRSDRARCIPVVMLTAKGDEGDIVAGLEIGADDYITKPFSTKVLAARVKAVLRRGQRSGATDPTTLEIRGLVIDPEKFEVRIKDKLLDLTPTEFRLISLLARRPGKVFTRGQIVDGVHGDDYPVTDRSIDVQIVGLRKKLGRYADDYIETVRGVGYRFKETD